MLNSFLAIVFVITAYCNCRVCCGKSPNHPAYGVTASGKRASPGTIAVDKRIISLGSLVKIEGFSNIFRAEDTGGAIKGNRIDIWFPSHELAKKFGVQRRGVTICLSAQADRQR